MTREAFENLEKRCMRLRIVYLLKWFLFLLTVAAAGFFVFTNFFAPQNLLKPAVVQSGQEKVLTKETAVAQTPVPIKNQETNGTQIEKNESVQYNTVLLKSPVVAPEVSEKKEDRKGYSDTKKAVVVPKEIKKEPIHIKRRTLQSESALLESNNENANFSSTLKLAEYYLKEGQYEKAIEYAVQANQYDRVSFAPWSLYAKTKIKQNKKGDAIKAIQSFLSYYNSKEAKEFLLEIEREK